MGKKRNDGFQGSRVAALSVVHLVHDIYTSYLAPALPKIIEKLGMSYGMAGLLAVIQRIPSLFNPLMGIIAERPSMKYLVIVSPAITAVAMSLIGIAPSYIFLAILLFVSGISSMMWHIPSPVMIKFLSGSRTGKGMSFYMVGGELARTLGPLVILGVIALWGLEGTWKMMPLGFVASFVLYLNFRNVDIKPSEQSRNEGNYWRIFRRYSAAFLLTGGFTFFQAGVKASLTYYLPTFLTDSEGHSLAFADISLTILQLAGAAGALFAGTISDRLGRTQTLLVISIVTPLLMLIFLNVEGGWIIPVLIPLGFFLFAPTAVMMAMVQDLNTEKKAFVNAIYMTINFFISSMVIPMVGVLTDHYGFQTSYMAFNILAFGAVGIVLYTRKKIGRISSG
ncbi:MAG: MFS transporter [Bacteroidales bacterium]|nr:MFS transporter [Bacteroidales bacterium]MDT8431624.1 MFS transporter [Bacteroidales bacterium]